MLAAPAIQVPPQPPVPIPLFPMLPLIVVLPQMTAMIPPAMVMLVPAAMPVTPPPVMAGRMANAAAVAAAEAVAAIATVTANPVRRRNARREKPPSRSAQMQTMAGNPVAKTGSSGRTVRSRRPMRRVRVISSRRAILRTERVTRATATAKVMHRRRAVISALSRAVISAPSVTQAAIVMRLPRRTGQPASRSRSAVSDR